MSLEYNTIKQEAIDLDIGESKTIYCPFCGVTHEAKCSITKEELGVLYHCFRASCGAKGFIPSLALHTPTMQNKKTFKPKPVTHDMEKVPDWLLEKLYNDHFITEEEVLLSRFKYAPYTQRLMMPAYTRQGFEFGYVGKYFGDDQDIRRKWKVVNYFETETTKLHYPITCNLVGGPVVLVEDILSSVRVGRHARTISLLGHGISNEQIKEIAGYGRDIILALDSDVIQKALSYKRKFGFSFRNFSIQYLSKDPKDLTDDEIKEEILR
jgi:hypothetical protein